MTANPDITIPSARRGTAYHASRGSIRTVKPHRLCELVASGEVLRLCKDKSDAEPGHCDEVVLGVYDGWERNEYEGAPQYRFKGVRRQGGQFIPTGEYAFAPACEAYLVERWGHLNDSSTQGGGLSEAGAQRLDRT